MSVCALLWVISSLIPQINRTLAAYEKLADTLEEELGPTLQEVQKVVVGVGELKQIAGQSLAGVSTKVEDVTGNINKAAGTAKKQSSVWGAGLLAGVKTYLEGKNDHGTDHNEKGRQSSDNRHITLDRGEDNVGLKR